MASIEVEVERLVNGPGALARGSDGRVVFLDDGLPGERVEARIVEDRRDFVRARVLRITGGSEQGGRRQAPCPVVAICGGCPWQHLEYSRQLAFKEDVVLREIWRACRARPVAVLEPIARDEWRTRSRIRLAVERTASLVVGYRARGSRRVVPFDDCQIAAEPLVAALPLARALAEAVPSALEIELAIDDRKALRLLGLVDSKRPVDARAALDALESIAREIDLRGVRLAGLALEPVAKARRGWRGRSEAGDVMQHIDVAPGIELGIPVGVFSQVNLALNRELVAVVMEAAAPAPGRAIVDLFCGAGNFAVPLAAAGASVFGVDADQRAIEAARGSAARLGVAERCRFAALPAEQIDEAALPERIDACILDPPRAGATDALRPLLARRPMRIVYVSCDVATFARDARAILGAGYEFSSLRLVDLTPQTFRAEVVGVFQLTW